VLDCKVKKLNYIAVGGVKMKKLILGIMLVTGSLSFSNDRDRGREKQNFEDLKLRAEAIHEQEQEENSSPRIPDENTPVKISNIFNDFKPQNINN